MKRLRFYINGRFLTQPATGVQRYAYELIRGWDEMFERREIDPQRYQLTILIPKISEPLQPYHHISVQPVGKLKGNLWEQVELPFYARNNFLFNPGNIGPLLKSNQGATIHDASVFAVPHSFSSSFLLKYRLVYLTLAKTARVIFTVSQFSRNELQRYCHIPADKIVVIPEGSDHISRIEADSSIFDRYHIGSKPYILTVGSFASHKNLGIFYQAAEMFSPDELDFICVGADFGRWFKSQFPLISERVKKLGYISDAGLKALYQKAAVLVFPSFYEGFGLPPLEAMRCGCPVIVSNISSLPEVCGNAALYFDPGNLQDLVEKIQLVVKDPLMGSEMREKGFVQAGKYRWAVTANMTWQSLVEYCQ